MVVVILLVLEISFAGGSVHSTSDQEGRDYEEAKSKAKHAQDKVEETAQETREASESWAEWAKEKIGLKQDESKETAKKASDMASDAAKKTRDKVEEAASGLSKLSPRQTTSIVIDFNCFNFERTNQWVAMRMLS